MPEYDVEMVQGQFFKSKKSGRQNKTLHSLIHLILISKIIIMIYYKNNERENK